MGSIPEFLIPTFMEVEAISHYLEIESSFMPEPTFYTNPANLKIRKLAVSIIAKHWTSQNTDAFVPYLAMNYFDRFASRNPDSVIYLSLFFCCFHIIYFINYLFLNSLLNSGFVKDAKVPLVAICCLTLASKMRTKSFSLDMIPVNFFLKKLCCGTKTMSNFLIDTKIP
ncbi:putative cyclin [Lupinus albus]|uniref:Putative cyclin n=1 Tax=Lupinus albus TaxID=3870 RepID=A0A6A4NMY1_LUPAL|nr:putative cyclin [Lupinus albus]